VIVRLGAEGALTSEGVVPPLEVVSVRDEIGAGDGFAAGFAWGRLSGWSLARSVLAAHFVAASVLGATGDWETYPDAETVLAALPG